MQLFNLLSLPPQAITFNPKALAISTVAMPTPPVAPRIKHVSPFLILALVTKAL